MPSLFPFFHETELLFDEVQRCHALNGLVGRVSLPDEVCVVNQEKNEHNSDYATEEDYDRKHFMLCLQILHDNPEVSPELLALLIVIDFIPQVLFVYEVLRAQYSNHETINANASVKKKEQNEILVILQADTIVDPDAMMIEFLHTDVAK